MAHSGTTRRVRFWRAAAASTIAACTIFLAAPQASPVSAYSAPWLSVEKYALYLVNCTRTGGWVLSDGTCRGYGSGHYSAYVKPLLYSTGISDRASRPYAYRIAVRNLCGHFYDGDPGYRLRRAGFNGSSWGENVGCGNGYTSAKAVVLWSHLRMQAEKSTNGGHWKNIKSTRYSYLGVGVWRYSGRTRLVEDFYHP